MLKGILVMSCIRPCVQLFMGLALCIADKSLGRNGQQIGMLMYPDDLCSAVIDNYGYYCLCPTIWFFFFLLAFFFLCFSKVRVGAKEGGSHYWEMAVAITCGYGGYLLPLLAAHSSLSIANSDATKNIVKESNICIHGLYCTVLIMIGCDDSTRINLPVIKIVSKLWFFISVYILSKNWLNHPVWCCHLSR